MLYVADSKKERREALSDVVMSAVLAALSIGLLGLSGCGRGCAANAPLERLSRRLASTIRSMRRRERTLGAAERAELVPVQRAIDELGERLAQRVARERMVAAHAAHALRTPLAGMDAQLAIACANATRSAAAAAARARRPVRLQRVVRSLLDLFRGGADPKRRSVALQTLLAHLPMQGLDVAVDVQVRIDADPDLLAAALANLLDNAQRHGATCVQVTQPAPDRVRVADDGNGIDAQGLAALRAALQTQAYEGRTGLGLMLADLVARAHGGRLELPDSAAGFTADLVLAPHPGAGE